MYNFVSFSYTPLFGVINCQIINCFRSFNGICKDDWRRLGTKDASSRIHCQQMEVVLGEWN